MNQLVKLTKQKLLWILLFVISSGFAASQNVNTTKLSLDIQNGTLVQIFDNITKKTNYNFTYGELIAKNKTKYQAIYDNKSLNTVLEDLGKRAQFDFKVIGTEIMIAKTDNKVGVTKNVLQQTTINGRVTDFSGQALVGASIAEKGTNNGTMTDLEGNFKLTVSNKNAVLIISFIGYKSKEVATNDKTNIQIQLAPDETRLEEVVVGYGSQKKQKVTGSVARIRMNELKDYPVTSFEQAIAGKLAGVQVLQTTGTPGGGMSIRVRGVGSISANNEPLFVIDGFPVSNNYNTSRVQGSRPSNATRRETPQNPLSTINPNDIESIEVLKDAAAAAIYGSRGSNGVILITTKKGSQGKSQIEFNSYYGFQQVTNTYKMANAYQATELAALAVNTTWVESGPNRLPNDPNSLRPPSLQIPAAFLPYLNKEPGLTNTDWQDAIFREAPIRNYELSVKSGTEKMQYFISGNYFDQEGIVVGSGFKRYAMRFNLASKLSDRLSLSVNLNPSFANSDLVPAENPYFVDGIVNNALLTFPIFPVYNPDGSLAVNGQNALGLTTVPAENPVALAEQIEDQLEQFRLIGGAALEMDLIKGLKFKSYLGFDINSFRRDYYRPSTIGNNGVIAPTISTGRSFTSRTLNWISENTLSFNVNLANNHNLNVLTGYSVQNEKISSNSLFATNFPNDLVSTLNAGQVTTGASNIEEWALMSYYGRMNYDYKNKYLLSASLRRDGSSRFGKNNKWGYFPAASLGWRLSEEGFFPKSALISDLKLRGSYGQTGNFEIPNYGSVSLLNQANYPISGSTNSNGLAVSNAPNSNLAWEKREMLNMGFDLGLFDNKLNLTADYYIANTKDLLLNVPVPGLTGFSTALQNVGAVKNVGVELGLTTNFTIQNSLKWSTSINFSANKNEVTALGQSGTPIISNGGVNGTHITQIGSPIGSYFGYNVLGTFNSKTELDSYPHLSNSQLGDFKFEDVNSDGKLDANDRKILGNYSPDFTYGITNSFSYKNIDFSFFLQGVQGNEILHLNQRYLTAFGFANITQYAYDNAWRSPENPGNGRVHRVARTITGGSNQVSSYMIEDGSYMRVRNITLGYSLPKSIVNQVKVNSIRMYITAQNPFTFTKYPGYNPEVNQRPEDALTQGEDYGTYPLAKSYVFGFNLTF